MLGAVIFDLDDTLYDYVTLDKKARCNVKDFACKTLHISEEKYQEAYLFGRQETKKQLPNAGAGHNRLLYYQKTLEYLGVMPMPLSLQMYERYWGTFLQEMELFPGVLELFDFLKKEDIPIMICTDLTAHIQHRKIERLGLAPYLSYLVSSEEAGKEKPAREIFDLCLKKLKQPPEHIWFVGDALEKDIKGARQAGMQTVWFHREQECTDTQNVTEEDAYIRVRDYVQIKEIFIAEIKKGIYHNHLS